MCSQAPLCFSHFIITFDLFFLFASTFYIPCSQRPFFAHIFFMAISSAIYQRCRSVLDGLALVPGCDSFGIQHPSAVDNNNGSKAELVDEYIPQPFYHLWKLCRQGAILCHLFNRLEPDHKIDLESCQKHKAPVYRFILACGEHLNLSQDDLFSVSELYQDNTNVFVKVSLIHHHHILKMHLISLITPCYYSTSQHTLMHRPPFHYACRLSIL